MNIGNNLTLKDCAKSPVFDSVSDYLSNFTTTSDKYNAWEISLALSLCRNM